MAKATRKSTAKSKATKKTSAKKTTSSASVSAAAKKKVTVTKPYTKSEILSYIADNCGISKKEASSVLENLSELMALHLNSKKGPGEFIVPGLMKCRVVRKPATKPRKGINPFTGQETMFQAKPARNVIKIRPLKKLKDMVA